MMVIKIPGTPIAQKRPRFARRGKFVTTYSDQETETGRMLLEIYRQVGNNLKPTQSPIRITTIFYMKRPKSHFGSGKNANRLKESAPMLHILKPDIDNLQKMVYDCLNGIVWVDDSQVCESHAKKLYSEQPRTEITISELEVCNGRQKG